MFATLLTGLPWPDAVHPDDPAAAVEAAVRAQEEAGLEPITDGRLGDHAFHRFEQALAADSGAPPSTVDAWRRTAGLSGKAVKQVLPGPYTLARRLGLGHAGQEGSIVRTRRTHALAEALGREAQALAAAGCPLVEIDEAGAGEIGVDENERRLFRQAHRRLTDGVTGTHLSLSIAGGSAAGAGVETILDAPYSSLAVDLITGPDNWNLVMRMAGERGVVVGALGSREASDEAKELLLWGVHYAASSRGRGLARVGLGSAGSWRTLTWAAAVRKMRLLGSVARLAELPPGDELMRSLDPKAISSRRAALGPDAPRPPKRRRPRR